LTAVVRPAATITLTSTPTSSVVGQSVIITASATPPTATGTLSFFDGTSALITNLPLSGGKVSFSVPNLSVGTHAITATYSGDGKNRGGTSVVLTQTVTAH
jgi:Bacterial Ig-like domain (group 3)